MTKLLALCSPGMRCETPSTQQPLRPHDVEDKDFVSVVAVKHAARRLDDLAIPRPSELLRPTATLRMIDQLLDVTKDALDERGCGDRVFECDVVCDSIQITKGWL